MKSIADIYEHYLKRAKMTVPTKNAISDPARFKAFLKTLPTKQEKFESFIGPDGRLREELFDQLWSCKDDKKSPGAPLYFKTPLNSGLEAYKAEIYEVVDERMAKLIALGKHLHDEDLIGVAATPEERVQLIQLGLADVMAVDLKSEARPIGKMPRLITLASVVDNLVSRLGYHNHLISRMDGPEVYMCNRLDVTSQESTRERYNLLKSWGTITGNDVQGWEYSVNSSDQYAAMWAEAYSMGLVDADLELREKGSPAHFYLLVGLTYALVNRVGMLPDGQLVLAPPGHMPSGVLITYYRNSLIRALLSFNVSMDVFNVPVAHCMTAGDDCQDTNNFETVQASAQAHACYGKKITDVETKSDNFEFCSTVFTSNGSYQLNIGKTAYNLLCEKRVGPEELEAFRVAYENHPLYEAFLSDLLAQAPQ